MNGNPATVLGTVMPLIVVSIENRRDAEFGRPRVEGRDTRPPEVWNAQVGPENRADAGQNRREDGENRPNEPKNRRSSRGPTRSVESGRFISGWVWVAGTHSDTPVRQMAFSCHPKGLFLSPKVPPNLQPKSLLPAGARSCGRRPNAARYYPATLANSIAIHHSQHRPGHPRCHSQDPDHRARNEWVTQHGGRCSTDDLPPGHRLSVCRSPADQQPRVPLPDTAEGKRGHQSRPGQGPGHALAGERLDIPGRVAEDEQPLPAQPR